MLLTPIPDSKCLILAIERFPASVPVADGPWYMEPLVLLQMPQNEVVEN